MSSCTESLSTNLISETVAKKPRGRPKKYTDEELKERTKEKIKKWQNQHKDEYKEYQKQYHEDFRQDILKQQKDYQQRARNALQLLAELIESDSIEFKDEKYKELATDLIKHKKIIYT